MKAKKYNVFDITGKLIGKNLLSVELKKKFKITHVSLRDSCINGRYYISKNDVLIISNKKANHNPLLKKSHHFLKEVDEYFRTEQY